MELESLELRLTPASWSDWNHPVELASSPDAIQVAGAMAGGGPRVGAYRADQELWSVYALEESFLGGVSLELDAERVYVGAGLGGGPRVVEYDLRSGIVLDSYLVGDPDSRNGVTREELQSCVRGTPRPVSVADPTPPPKDPESIGVILEFSSPVGKDLVDRLWLGTQVRWAISDATGLSLDKIYSATSGGFADEATRIITVVVSGNAPYDEDVIAAEALSILGK